MDGFSGWLAGSIFMWFLGESLNCSFPYHDGEEDNAGLVCQWKGEDFYYDDKEEEWILIPEDSDDNWIEAKFRKKYWDRKNVD